MKKTAKWSWTFSGLGLVFLLLVSSSPSSSDPTDPAEEFEFTPVTLRTVDVQSSAGAIDGIEEATDAQLRRHDKPIQRGLRRSHRPVKHVEPLLVDERIMRDFRAAPHGYLQFDEIPDFQARRSLRDQGVLLTSYAGNNTYVAAVNARGRQFLDSARGITEAGVIPIEKKVERNLLEGKIYPWARDEAGRVLIDVRFHKNVSLDDARGILELYGGVALDDSGYPWFFVLSATMDAASIPEFAGADPVRNVSMKAPNPISHNANAAGVSNVDVLWQPPYNLSGAGYAVGVWDVGAIHAHAEFGSRITYVDWTAPLEPEDYASHATHVAGTIGASGELGTGYSQAAHGMANQVGLSSYSTGGFSTEYVQAILDGLLFASNNGWGWPLGWDWYKPSLPPQAPFQWVCAPNQDDFGKYSMQSAQIDSAARIAELSGQTFPIIWSAGNERDDEPGDGSCPWDLPG
jgi:hypothetical protein